MNVKTQLYLDNLYKHLGICGADEITEDHIEVIKEYINNHDLDPEVFKELIKTMPDFASYAKSTMEELIKTYNKIIDAGVSDTQSLKEIINYLSKLLEKENLTENDKDRIIDLILSFKQSLDDTLKRNDTNRKLLIAASLTAFAILTFAVYKAAGGKGGEKIIKAGTQVGTKAVEA